MTAHKLPRQMENIELGKKIKEGVKVLKDTVNASFVLVISLNAIMLMGISYIWSLINSLQMVLYLPICPISFPGNIMLLYGVFIPLSTLDVVPPEVTEHLFDFSQLLQYPFNERLEFMGHEDMNTINNLGSIFYFVVGNSLLWGLAAIIEKRKCCHRLNKVFKKRQQA